GEMRRVWNPPFLFPGRGVPAYDFFVVVVLQYEINAPPGHGEARVALARRRFPELPRTALRPGKTQSGFQRYAVPARPTPLGPIPGGQGRIAVLNKLRALQLGCKESVLLNPIVRPAKKQRIPADTQRHHHAEDQKEPAERRQSFGWWF